MTLDEFFAIARTRTWHVDREGHVRCEFGYCPGQIVTKLQTGRIRSVPDTIADELNMDISDVARIVRGADNVFSEDRAWLLQQLGYTEPVLT